MRKMRIKFLFPLLAMVLAIGFLTGCGSGGGGDGNNTNPAEGSTWDEMVWDQGQWG